MSTITKERVAGIASGEKCYTHDDVAELARIALASLEAEAVAWMWERDGKRDVDMDNPHDGVNRIGAKKAMDAGWKCSPLYPAPPATVSVPDEKVKGDDFELDGPLSCYQAGKIDGWNEYRASMLQSFGNSEQLNPPVIPDGWVMVPKNPTEFMFNAGKVAAGHTKQPDTASLVYKAMIDSSPDYKVGREAAYTGYEVQENVKDYVRRKIRTAFDVEKAVLWILKNNKYPEPDFWMFDIKVHFCDGPVILTDESVTIVHSTLCKCSPPVGNVQFIECTLPAEWEGKVNAIDCVFKAAPQQEVK